MLMDVDMLWQPRKNLNHGEIRLSADSFACNVRRHVHEWETFLSKEKKDTVIQNVQWAAPPGDFIKINVDATFKQDSNTGGCNVIGQQRNKNF